MVEKEFDFAQNKLKEQVEKEREAKKKNISQGYETAFKFIASKTDTTEILSGLAKRGYTITKIEWTGKIHAPSLTGGISVRFSLVKK